MYPKHLDFDLRDAFAERRWALARHASGEIDGCELRMRLAALLERENAILRAMRLGEARPPVEPLGAVG